MGNSKTHFDARDLGERIAKLRKEAGLSQKQLADLLGITSGYLAHIEIGGKTPSLDLLVDMAGLFNVSLDYLAMAEQVDKDLYRVTLREVIRMLSELENGIIG